MLRPYTRVGTTSGWTGRLQPALQEFRREPLQPARDQREAVGHEQQAENDQQDARDPLRSEEHTSELQSRLHLVCRLLLEKKKKLFFTDTLRGQIVVSIAYARV